jgi:hypothetical protein
LDLIAPETRASSAWTAVFAAASDCLLCSWHPEAANTTHAATAACIHVNE